MDTRPTDLTLSRIWRPAAALGGVWAASEIVLGSFLHSFRVPQAGLLMALLSVMLVCAFYARWPLRGMVWRAGFVCALMKSLSPSAVLLGPMIGITLEALLLEAGLRLGRRKQGGALSASAVGCMAGGALAVMTVPLQRLVRWWWILGGDFWTVLHQVVRWIVPTGDETLGAWGLLAAGFGLHALAGAVAGLAGLRCGQRQTDSGMARSLPSPTGGRPPVQLSALRISPRPPVWLLLHAAMLPAGAWLLNAGRLHAAAGLMLAYAVLVGTLYAPVLRRMARPMIPVSLLLLAAGLVVVLPGPDTGRAILSAWLRALFVMVSFACLGHDLRHPAVGRFLMARGAGQVWPAVELAFSALPRVLAGFVHPKQFCRSPLRGVENLLSEADFWATCFTLNGTEPCRLVVLAGFPGEGKSRLIRQVIRLAQSRGQKVNGIFQEPHPGPGGAPEGFDVVDASTGMRRSLCRRGRMRTGFAFDPDGIAFGRQVLQAAVVTPEEQLTVVDEIGRIEVDGDGWAPVLPDLLHARRPLLLAVRKQVLPELVRQYNIKQAVVFDVADCPEADILLQRLRTGES